MGTTDGMTLLLQGPIGARQPQGQRVLAMVVEQGRGALHVLADVCNVAAVIGSFMARTGK